MRKFKFTLEAYLKTKEMAKDKKIEELNLMKNELQKIIENMEAIENEKLDIENKCKILLKSGISNITFSQITECINEKINSYKTAEQELEKIQNIISAMQEDLKKIVSEIKSIEKLKEKQYEEYLESVKKETERFTEDFLNSNKKNEEYKLKF